jgi:hypothetical protein
MSPPSAIEVQDTVASTPAKTHTIPEIKKSAFGLTQSASYPTPLQYSGTLDHYESFDVTSVIGREFPKLQLSEILKDDAKVRDLAILGRLCPDAEDLDCHVNSTKCLSVVWSSSGIKI